MRDRNWEIRTNKRNIGDKKQNFSFLILFLGREGRPLESKEKALRLARIALDKKAKDVLILDLKGLTIIADYFVICSGESTTHVRAIAESIEEKSKKAGIKIIGIEGLTHSRWVLIDYGDLIVHVFEEGTRSFYEIEKLWMDARSIPIGEIG